MLGLERERRGASIAGIRTFPLVAVASCGFIQAIEGIVLGNPEATARVVEGVITGIGFIGGGAILKDKGDVTGLVTAAGVWNVGAIGVAVGYGQLEIAVTLSALNLAGLLLLTPIAKAVEREETKDG